MRRSHSPDEVVSGPVLLAIHAQRQPRWIGDKRDLCTANEVRRHEVRRGDIICDVGVVLPRAVAPFIEDPGFPVYIGLRRNTTDQVLRAG